MGKGKTAKSRTISRFSTVFSKDLYCRYVKKKKKKTGLVWERVKGFFFFFLNTAGNLLKTLWERVFLNIV